MKERAYKLYHADQYWGIVWMTDEERRSDYNEFNRHRRDKNKRIAIITAGE